MSTRTGDRVSGELRGVAAAACLTCLLIFGVLALLVTIEWRPLLRLDRSVALDLNDVVVEQGWLADSLNLATDVFAPWVFRVAVLVVAIVLLRRGWSRLALWVLVTVWGGGLLVVLVKSLTDRPRPVVPETVSTAAGSSFPSGHALGAAVGCAALLAVAWPVLSRPARAIATAAAVTLALLVPFTRVALGVHFTSDVVGGVALGLAWLAGTAAVLQPWRRPDTAPADDESPTELSADEGRITGDHRDAGSRDTGDAG